MVAAEIQWEVNGSAQGPEVRTQPLTYGATSRQVGYDRRAIAQKEVGCCNLLFVRIGRQWILQVHPHRQYAVVGIQQGLQGPVAIIATVQIELHVDQITVHLAAGCRFSDIGVSEVAAHDVRGARRCADQEGRQQRRDVEDARDACHGTYWMISVYAHCPAPSINCIA